MLNTYKNDPIPNKINPKPNVQNKNLKDEEILRERIREQVKDYFEESDIDPDAEYTMPSFNEFYGFKSPFPILKAYTENAADYGFLTELLEHGCKDDLPGKYSELAAQNLLSRRIVALDVENQNDAETINLFALLPEAEIAPGDSTLTNTQRIEMVADIYATYDQLRRLVALGSLVFHEKHKPCFDSDMANSLWDEYEELKSSSYNSNRARITFDKSNKLEKELRRTKAFLEQNNFVIEKDYLEEMLSSSEIDKGNNRD